MKIILDLFPILLFFAAYKYASIYEATAVLMGATVVQSLLMYKMDGKLSTMQKASLGLILVFGSLTLFLHDDRFIKFKPTLLYGCLALALWVSQFVFKRNLLMSMLGSQVNLPPANWHTLNIGWIAYCVFMAAINAYVASYYTTEQWVDFKIWGYVFPLTFIVGTGFYIAKYAVQPADETPNTDTHKGADGS
jgi:intracellular septation protein